MTPAGVSVADEGNIRRRLRAPLRLAETSTGVSRPVMPTLGTEHGPAFGEGIVSGCMARMTTTLIRPIRPALAEPGYRTASTIAGAAKGESLNLRSAPGPQKFVSLTDTT